MSAQTLAAGATGQAVQPRTRTNLQLARRRFMRRKLAVVGLVITLALLFVAISAPLIAPKPYDYANLMEANQFPSWSHPMGTDAIGHDYLSRIVYGIRTSLLVGFAAVLVACLIGLPLGMAAGLRGGAVAFVVLRIIEVMSAIPFILFAIFLISVVNSGFMSSVFN